MEEKAIDMLVVSALTRACELNKAANVGMT